ncbi:MAG: hypothetical protein JXP34_12160 [Planctomycetes bacterium]|nr:hypothetical protein [Planctomycetota bacterium]
MIAPILVIAAGSLAAAAPAPEVVLHSPGFPPSRVDARGALVEDWGAVSLALRQPAGAGAPEVRYDAAPVPTAVAISAAGPVTLVRTMYRSPIWPGGVDVLAARLANASDAPIDAAFDLVLPESVSLGETIGAAGGRAVIALPKGLVPARREERPWGCTGGVTAMPNWAKPEGPCDPAFRNISAGMGGVPINYRFTVPAGASRTIVLGFCESHWASAGRRPVEIAVEGAPKSEIDPVGVWGQHKPGCLRFDARDANQDGRLQVAILPHPKASDRNTILNAIWVFAPDAALDLGDVLRGKMTPSAEVYVDVGGEKDQMLYKGGTVTYRVRLDAKAERELLFLLASPGSSVLPDPETMAWTPATLRKAAEDVWAGATTAKRD